MPLVALGRDQPLQLGEALEALALQPLGHVVREVERLRPLLRRVRERADAVELHLLEEREQRLVRNCLDEAGAEERNGRPAGHDRGVIRHHDLTSVRRH